MRGCGLACRCKCMSADCKQCLGVRFLASTVLRLLASQAQPSQGFLIDRTGHCTGTLFMFLVPCCVLATG
jgi:hypothetical protein